MREPEPDPAESSITIVAGRPTAAEIAALTVVLATLSGRRSALATSGPPGGPSQGWADRRRGLRTPLRAGPDAWRFSARP